MQDDHDVLEGAQGPGNRPRSRRRLPVTVAAVGAVVVVAVGLLVQRAIMADDAVPGGPASPARPSATGSASSVAPPAVPGLVPVGPRPAGEPFTLLPVNAVLADGASLTVYSTRGGCSTGAQVELLETPDQVTIGLRDYMPDGYGDGAGVMCIEIAYGVALDVELAARLGDRPVVDAASTSPIPVLDSGTVLRPTYLPTGYQVGGTSVVAAGGGPVASTSLTDGGSGSATIEQGGPEVAEPPVPEAFDTTGTVDVRGAAAAWGEAPGQVDLRWQVDGHGFRIMASGLSLDEVVLIANGLA